MNFQPKFRRTSTVMMATERVNKQRDVATGQYFPAGMQTVPQELRGCQTNIWVSLLTRPFVLGQEQALLMQFLVPQIEMNHRLYASLAYLQPVLLEKMLVVYSIDLNSKKSLQEVIVYRPDIDPYEDEDLLKLLSERPLTAAQWLSCNGSVDQGRRHFEATSEFVLPAFVGSVTTMGRVTPINKQQSQFETGTSSSLGVRLPPSQGATGVHALTEFVPLKNHDELVAEDQGHAPTPPETQPAEDEPAGLDAPSTIAMPPPGTHIGPPVLGSNSSLATPPLAEKPTGNFPPSADEPEEDVESSDDAGDEVAGISVALDGEETKDDEAADGEEDQQDGEQDENSEEGGGGGGLPPSKPASTPVNLLDI